MQYFLRWRLKRIGPYEIEEIRLLLRTREIDSSTTVETQSGNLPVQEFLRLAVGGEAPSPGVAEPEIPAASAPEPGPAQPSGEVLRIRPQKRPAINFSLGQAEVLQVFLVGLLAAIGSLFFLQWFLIFLSVAAGVFLIVRQKTAPAITIFVLTGTFAFLRMGLHRETNSTAADFVSSTTALDLSALHTATKPAVVQVLSFDENENLLKTGSGFFISPSRVVTNFHVVEGASQVGFVLDDQSEAICTEVLHLDEARDIAVLETDEKSPSFLVLEKDLIKEGERVAVIGSPLGLEGTLSEGIVSAVRTNENGIGFVQISAPISPGSSGSPVVNRYGKVIGIATMIHTGGQSLNFAVSAKELADVLRKSSNSTTNP
jgi:S1-C subfamily serine protease